MTGEEENTCHYVEGRQDQPRVSMFKANGGNKIQREEVKGYEG